MPLVMIRYKKEYRGYVVPDSFTHGTSKQRVEWFNRGFKYGDLEHGDTFNEKTLDFGLRIVTKRSFLGSLFFSHLGGIVYSSPTNPNFFILLLPASPRWQAPFMVAILVFNLWPVFSLKR